MTGPVVILGAQGMLGQALAAVFSDLSPLLLDRSDLDITNQEAVQKLFTQIQPAIVINVAAYNNVDGAESDEGYQIAQRVNAEAPQYLARICKELGALFVHYSSDYVFQGDSVVPYTEEDVPNPQSRYAQSKYDGEKQALAVGGKQYLIRTCRLFGAPGNSTDSKRSFVDLMLALAKEKDHLEVVNEEVASPTYVVDLARQTRLLIEEEYPYGIYHITNSGSCTWYEYAKEIFTERQITIPLTPVPASAFPRPAARPAYSVLANTKLPPLRPWQEALREYLQTSAGTAS